MHHVTVIIPAYNEALRLPGVVEAVRHATLVDDILVIDDGSQDGTADVAAAAAVPCRRLEINQGKGTAMRVGAMAATGDVVLFLDADLQGLTSAQVDALIAPVLHRQADMSVGIFRGGRTFTDLAQRISPNLSGQRCLRRDAFLETPLIEGSRYGVEIALTIHAAAMKFATTVVPLDGVTHPVKEEKMGMWQGLLSRWRMWIDILVILLRYQLATRFSGRTAFTGK